MLLGVIAWTAKIAKTAVHVMSRWTAASRMAAPRLRPGTRLPEETEVDAGRPDDRQRHRPDTRPSSAVSPAEQRRHGRRSVAAIPIVTQRPRAVAGKEGVDSPLEEKPRRRRAARPPPCEGERFDELAREAQ